MEPANHTLPKLITQLLNTSTGPAEDRQREIHSRVTELIGQGYSIRPQGDRTASILIDPVTASGPIPEVEALITKTAG
ncbi:MAG: hypothetical protein TR69_WS6001000910 [candidate division WS6 bacterium OLB20]|uniref:Uncharacterized protein n=1 Tax=candidate division WS6 bacterium OLB20 TaxID=1617426 RepID=A0A136LZ21_9BACT|nr:MAG: hypothetical protein TR69_WS6001000910 [candidate division WS6 bacterium OLB20]